MKKGFVCALAAALVTFTLAGCASQDIEEPTVPFDPTGDGQIAGAEQPADGEEQNPALGLPTDPEKLKNMALGETAVWKNYAVAVDSIDRTDGQLVAHITVTSRGTAMNLSTENLLSFGMPPVETSFTDNIIMVAPNETATGTLTFDDQYTSQRLFWNDGATEATWNLELEPVQPSGQPATNPEQQPEQKNEPDNAQKQAVAAIEGQIPDLLANNTYYTFQSLDPATATVTPQDDGGWQYDNTISILDGGGNPATTTLRTWWDATGTDCRSMEIDGALLF